MRYLLLPAALLFGAATAQTTIFTIPALPPAKAAPAQTAQVQPAPVAGPVARVEIQDVEVTSPVSTGASPTIASDDVGEVLVPVLATDKDGTPVAGVAVEWEVKNTGKAELYIISATSGGAAQNLAVTLAPGDSWKGSSTTGADGSTTLLLNATASTAASLKLSSPLGEVKNLRDAAQSIDWIQ